MSASPANSTPLQPGADASAATPSQGPQQPAAAPFGPGNPLLTLLFISDNNWPKDLCLNCSKSNWESGAFA
jgi:hypothetical protein